MSLRERQKREKLSRIVKAARRLFRKKGYDGTTTREIAQEAGVATGTLFVYFPEKRDLLLELFLRDVQRLMDQTWKTLPEEAGLVDQVAFVFGRIYDFYERDPKLGIVFVKELPFLEGESAERMNGFNVGFLMQLAAVVKRATLAGEVGSHVEAGQAAYQLFSLYFMGLITWLTGAVTRAQMEKQLRVNVELLHRGLAS